MSSNVFANGREISAMADDNKSICAMPDVCLSPPSPPAGPVPIPYPNTAKAADTDEGSKTVMIGGKEVGLKNKSNYKTSTGDEAATKSLGMGVVTHQIQGKMFHAAWSFDVQIEGENAIRHMDMTTHNHGSLPPNLASTVDVAAMAPSGPTKEDCEELDKNNKKDRDSLKKDDRTTYEEVGDGTTTITNAKFSAGGSTVGLKACSRAVATDFDNGFVKGPLTTGNPKTVNKNSNLCDKAKKDLNFKYRQTESRPHTSHTESRLIEHIMGKFDEAGTPPQGTLLMSIDWNKKPPSKEPCRHCKRVICAAQACGLKIKLCKGKPSKPTDPDPCEPPDDLC
jgi:Domain of unknown function (DUF4150)